MFSFDLSKVPFYRAFTIAALLYAGIVAPFWFLFQFQKTLFDNIENIRLLIICAAIGFPIILLNVAIAYVAFTFNSKGEPTNEIENETEETSQFMAFVFSSSLNVLTLFYTPCIITFWIDISFNNAVTLMLVGQVLISIYLVVAGENHQKKAQVQQGRLVEEVVKDVTKAS